MAKFTSGQLTPDAFTSHWEEFDITVEDSIRLRGWFIHSRSEPALGTILILHGIASCRTAMLPDAKLCIDNGFNCVLYDARAHGESGGRNCTFGYFEKRDISAYIDSTLARYPRSAPFGIIGNSFGAAVTIQAMAMDKRLVCGVAESSFASLREVIHDYFREMFFIPADWIPDAALTRSETIAHFVVDSVCPAEDARKITQPVMIVHGGSDRKIAPARGRQIYDNLASAKKELYIISGAGHDDLAHAGGVEYRQRLLTFFKRYLGPAGLNNVITQ